MNLSQGVGARAFGAGIPTLLCQGIQRSLLAEAHCKEKVLTLQAQDFGGSVLLGQKSHRSECRQGNLQ